MKKLGAAIRFECTTSFKYIWIFYACVFTAVSIISAIIYVSTGNLDKIGTNGLEINSMIYTGILGVLGFKDDFKMLIQNGFTRKYIFLSTFSLFAFVSAIMAFVDTIIGNTLHTLSNSYHSIFGGLYGYEHSVFMNWLWLFLVYMLVCCLFYLVILSINKIGKTMSIYAGIIFALVIVLIMPVIFRFILPKDFTDKLKELAVKGIGFMADGTINFMYPVLILLLAGSILSICSYFILHKTELSI